MNKSQDEFNKFLKEVKEVLNDKKEIKYDNYNMREVLIKLRIKII